MLKAQKYMGVGPSPLVNSLELPKSSGERLVTSSFWLMKMHFYQWYWLFDMPPF